MTKAIPITAFDECHTAILGKTGSGKTNTGKHIVETLYHAGRRVCVLDPIKSDWWGVTANRAGTGPGLPFTIIGGPRGAMPLPAGSGAVIGQLVASGELPHVIIDMRNLGRKEFHPWFCAFAEAVWKSISGAVHVVLEEAPKFAPKEKFGDESDSTYWAKQMATAGRSIGLRFVYTAQRTQQLHNDLLSSSNLIVAHRTIFPADRKPVMEWIRAFNPDKTIAEKVDSTLSTLRTGEAWVCDAEAQTVELCQIPLCATYDNSKTPATGDKAKRIHTAQVDVPALQAKLEAFAAEVAANDPKALKAEISRLTRELAGAGRAEPPAPCPRCPELEKANAEHERWRRSAVAALKNHAALVTADYAGLVFNPETPHNEVQSISLVPK